MKSKPKKIIVGIDMDGVLANFDKGVGRPGHEQDPPEMFVPGFFRNLEVMPGAREAITELLKNENLKLYICSKPTTKALNCASEKYEWINEHFPELLKRMNLMADKELFAGDYLIDDDYHRWGRKFSGYFIHFDLNQPEQSWQNILEFFRKNHG